MYSGNDIQHYKLTDISKKIKSNKVSSMLLSGDGLWLGTSEGLIQRDKTGEFSFYPLKWTGLNVKSRVTGLVDITEDAILVSTQHHLFVFNKKNQKYKHVPLKGYTANYFKLLWQDDNQEILVGTTSGLFRLENNKLKPLYSDVIQGSISGIVKYGGYYWVSSLKNGLWRIDSKSKKITQFKADNVTEFSLKENSISTLYLDHDGLIWLGGFMGSILYFDTKKLSFGFHDRISIGSNCLTSESVSKIFFESENTALIITENDLVKFNHRNNQCERIELTVNFKNQKVSVVPVDIIHGQHEQWLLSDLGIHKLTPDYSLTEFTPLDFISAYFVSEPRAGYLTIGTNTGLIFYDQSSQQVHKPKAVNQVLSTATYYSYISLNKGKSDELIVFNSNKGLVYINSSGELDYFSDLSVKHPDLDAISIATNSNGHMWVGSYKKGLFKLNHNGQIVGHINQINGHDNFSVYSIKTDDLNQLWLGTDIGLVKLNSEDNSASIFQKNDGLQGDFFNINSAAKSTDGLLYFGGRNGLNIFDPKSITDDKYSKKPALTGVRRFNKEVKYFEVDNPLALKKPIDLTKRLILDHQDYIVSLSFSALNLSEANNVQYAYMLDGFDPDWNVVSSAERTATYTNLPSGNYTFKLKAALKNQKWGSGVKTLDIKVLPPPWLSWWAIFCYILFIAVGVYGFIHWKIRANVKIAAMLRVKVKEKTEELHIQKQKIESLLARKNELFSNVSHEFRTPLTLILGPIKHLLREQADAGDLKQLNMVNRNANRLLSLVEQLLQIARVSDLNNIQTRPQKTKKQVQLLVESFQHMAQHKKIELQLQENDQATVNVTEQYIDTVLGNLLSNAIKYTSPGGKVLVRSKANKKGLVLSVKDSGAGLTEAQQQDIFKRFKRLESHQEIEGIGIGLSVVEEVVKINKGTIKVKSDLGVGSTFIVNVPLSDQIADNEDHSMSTLVKQFLTETEEVNNIQPGAVVEISDKKLNTILVIEDNHDMREHIVSIINPHYNCLTAINGLKGVAIAAEEVPDLIISDVMMPELNGFKVARIIRSDQRTSHIPLMLLTALNDKASRIKGWRENVDAYMSKPFDSNELLIQVENMLVIRDILKKQAALNVRSTTSRKSMLPKKDEEFVKRLQSVIEAHYQDSGLNREKLANEMAVSERQLQRKLKALIDQNPMDMLREYRLNTSKRLLNDGYQVSQIADDCGFNSLSYFSQCFKAQFGLSPSKYLNKK